MDEIKKGYPKKMWGDTFRYAKAVERLETRSVKTFDRSQLKKEYDTLEKSGMTQEEAKEHFYNLSLQKAYISSSGDAAPIFEAIQYFISKMWDAVNTFDEDGNRIISKEQFRKRIIFPDPRDGSDVFLKICLTKEEFENYALDGLPYKTELWHNVEEVRRDPEQILPIPNSFAYLKEKPIRVSKIYHVSQLKPNERAFFEDHAQRVLANSNSTLEQIQMARGVLERKERQSIIGIRLEIYYPLVQSLFIGKDGEDWTQMQKAFYYHLYHVAKNQQELEFKYWKEGQNVVVSTKYNPKFKTNISGTLKSIRKILEYLFLKYNDAPTINVDIIDMWEHVNPSELDYRPTVQGDRPRPKHNWWTSYCAVNMAIILLNNMEREGGQFPFAPIKVGKLDRNTWIMPITVIPHVKREKKKTEDGEKIERTTVIFGKENVDIIETQADIRLRLGKYERMKELD